MKAVCVKKVVEVKARAVGVDARVDALSEKAAECRRALVYVNSSVHREHMEALRALYATFDERVRRIEALTDALLDTPMFAAAATVDAEASADDAPAAASGGATPAR